MIHYTAEIVPIDISLDSVRFGITTLSDEAAIMSFVRALPDVLYNNHVQPSRVRRADLKREDGTLIARLTFPSMVTQHTYQTTSTERERMRLAWLREDR